MGRAPRRHFSIATAPVALLAASATTEAAKPRPPWTTSHITGTPAPPPPYRLVQAFANLAFDRAVDIVSGPTGDRIFLALQGGKIFSFPNRSDTSDLDAFCDLRAIPNFFSTYGMTFHPRFAQRRFIYVMYVVGKGGQNGSRVSRFGVTEANPPRCDLQSETIFITWRAGGHNGGGLAWANDGTLFISSGDGAAPFPPDSMDVGQSLGDLLSSVLRIDVDHPSADRPYSVPADNPFVATPGARPEVWAYGFRNPWRISVDASTGDLWTGDVGWETWEMVHRIERGGNYGWSVMEGPLRARQNAKPGPTPILPPIAVHAHPDSRSITGGHVYRGNALPELRGAYVYGDYATGRMWGLRYDAKVAKVTWRQDLADTRRALVSFGRDPGGELLALHYLEGTNAKPGRGESVRLVAHPAAKSSATFPRRLSETGLFRKTTNLSLARGVVPYTINAEPWADGDIARRFVALPGRTTIASANGDTWRFPPGAVLGKTLSKSAADNSRIRRPIETQVSHFDGSDWHLYRYRWNDAGTDATLVLGAGDCAACHNRASGLVLGFAPAQLARRDAGHGNDGLPALVRQGVLAAAPDHAITRFASADDQSADLETRARSYLHVNCAHCHRPGGGSNAALDLDFTVPLFRTGIVGTRPTQGTFALPDAQLIAPGDPFRSVLFYRLATIGGGHMPKVGSRAMDAPGVALMEAWIRALGTAAPETKPGADATLADSVAAAESLRSVSAGVAQPLSAIIDRLLASTSGALMLARLLDDKAVPALAQADAVARGAQSPRSEICGLFERFVPERDRAPRLGFDIDPQQILSLAGDADRGRKVLLASSVACFSCHRIGTSGRAFGPELSHVGTQRTREQILTSILEPSKQIEPRYVLYAFGTTDGKEYSGLITDRSKDTIVLVDATGQQTRLDVPKVKILDAQATSAMPEGLLAALTAQEAADLLAFLVGLK